MAISPIAANLMNPELALALPKSSVNSLNPSSISGLATEQKIDSIRTASLSVSPPRLKISLKKMSPNQWKNYYRAMCYRGANKGTEVFKNMMRSSFATLTGFQLSGIFNSQAQSTINSWLSIQTQYAGNFTYNATSPLTIGGSGISLRSTFDHLLIFSIDNMTYATAVGWFIAHTFSPSIQRYLVTKEETFLRKILEEQHPREAPRTEIVKTRTLAEKISYLIEYFMPVIFDASQTAIILHLMERVNSLNIIGGPNGDFDVSNPPLNISIEFSVNNTFNELLYGDPPISISIIYILLACGTLLYAGQAWCNFHHDLQTKESESTPSIAMEDPQISLE
jgi:hypothetical protein